MQIPNAHTRLTPSLEIPPSIRGRGRRKGGSSTSQPHPQRVLNLSKKSQLKSMGERGEEEIHLQLLKSIIRAQSLTSMEHKSFGARQEKERAFSFPRVLQEGNNGEWMEEEERERRDPSLSSASQPSNRCSSPITHQKFQLG